MNVRQIVHGDIGELASVMARSFERDPFFAWMYGDSAQRLTRSFRAQLRVQFVPRGIGKTVEGLRGVAIWSEPGRGVSPTFMESFRMSPAHRQFLWPPTAIRVLRAFNTMDSSHPDEPHIHLSLLAVDPRYQRSGVGATLLSEGLARADSERLPVYLDTANPENLPYYERFGFAIVWEFDIPSRGPRCWGMLRRASSR